MSRRLSGMPIKDVRQNFQQAVDFRLSDDQRRNKTEHVFSRRVDEQSALDSRRRRFSRPSRLPFPCSKPNPHIADHVVTVLAFGQALAQVLAHPAGVIEDPPLEQDAEHRQGRSAGQRVPAEGRGV